MTFFHPTFAAASATVVVVSSLESNLSTGSVVVTILLGVGTVIGAIYGVKWKSTAQAALATIKLWEDNAAGEKLRAENAEADKARIVQMNAELRARIATLEALPNLEALAAILERHDAILERHEIHAEARSNRQLAVLERIEQRLAERG